MVTISGIPITENEASDKLTEIKNNLVALDKENEKSMEGNELHQSLNSNLGDNSSSKNISNSKNTSNDDKKISKNNESFIEQIPADQNSVSLRNSHSKYFDKNDTSSYEMKQSNLISSKNPSDDLTVNISLNFDIADDLDTNKLTASKEQKNTLVKPTGFLFPSFANIVAFGPNAAIVHHIASNTRMNRENLILIDSGSQYLFATTDITRTIIVDKPSASQIHDYTLILKGTILSKRLKGNGSENFQNMIEDLPKYYLWQENKDYLHSTSHGIGTGLFVHENPPFATSQRKIEPHQVFSIEPGYYKEGKYGIRIEDAVISLIKEMTYLENLTFVPYQKNLIDKSLLTFEEINYLNKYHQNVREILGEFLTSEEERKWLDEQTSPL